MSLFKNTKGVVQCYGDLRKIKNNFNHDQVEEHLVMENCLYGSLHTLSMFTKPFEEGPAYIVFNQIALTLRTIHQQRILHLDLKEANILITFDDEKDLSLNNQTNKLCGCVPLIFKIADFGVARDLNEPY
jgi:serine/threonine protein kinase